MELPVEIWFDGIENCGRYMRAEDTITFTFDRTALSDLPPLTYTAKKAGYVSSEALHSMCVIHALNYYNVKPTTLEVSKK